jgi:hypothetical protein
MMKAIRQFFNMLSVLFGAGEKLAMSLDDLASYAQEGSAQVLKEARLEREAEYRKLEAQLK